MDVCEKKQAHCRATDPADVGDLWIWRAIALPSRLRVTNYLSHERSESAARAFLAQFKAHTDGAAPFFTSDALPAYVQALMDNYSQPEPPPLKRGRGRPRPEAKRLMDPELRYAQVDKQRVGGRVVAVKRHIIFGTSDDIIHSIESDGCGSDINTAYVERDNLSARQHNGRLVRKTLSHSKLKYFLQCQLDLDDAVYNFVRSHGALRIKLRRPVAHGRKWQPRTPAMAAGLTDHLWTLDELLAYRLAPTES